MYNGKGDTNYYVLKPDFIFLLILSVIADSTRAKVNVFFPAAREFCRRA